MRKIEWGNPYTHEEYSRTTYSKKDLHPKETCHWCGNRNRFGGLFSYNCSPKKFCSKECHKIYYS